MHTNKAIAALLAGMLLFSGVGAALNVSASSAPNPYLESTVEKQTHNMAEHGPLEYEADDGSTAKLQANLNSDSPNPFSFSPTQVDYGQGEFPVKSDESDNSASTLDASEWMVGSNTTVSDTSTADGVEAVRIDSDGTLADGDSSFNSYDNVSIDSDEDKRFLTFVGDINQIESGASVSVQVYDEDGDMRSATIDPAANADDPAVIANQTGDGVVYQIQLGELDTVGDGEFNNIERIDILQQNGDSDITITHLSLDHTKPIVFGSERYDSNGDGEITSEDETRTVTESRAGTDISVTSLDSMGATFDDAVIHGLALDVRFTAEHLESEDVNASATETDAYPGYDYVANVHYRLDLPTAYELDHTSTSLGTETALPGERYLTVEYAEGVGEDTEFSDVNYENDVTSSFGAQGNTVTMDDTVQPGDEFAVHFELKLTEDEWSSMQSDDGAAVGPMDGGDSGLGSIPVIGGALALLTALWAKFRSSV